MKATPSLSDKTRLILFVSLVTLSGVALAVVAKVIEQSESRTSSYPVPITRVELDVGSGDVNLQPSPAGAEVNIATTYTVGKPTVTERTEGGTLKLRQRCGSVVVGTCESNYSVKVPVGAEVMIKTNSGDINARDLRTVSRLQSKSGNINAEKMIGPVDATTTAGDVNVTDAVSLDTKVRTTSGKVSTTASTPGNSLDIETKSGDIAVRLAPEGEPYRLVSSSVSGRVTTKVRTAPDAVRSVNVRSATGDVDIEARKS